MRAARDAPRHRPDQQREDQRQRDDGDQRPVSRCIDGQGRDQPGQHGSEQHHRARDGVCGPLVRFPQFAPVSAAKPGEHSLDPGDG